MALTEERHMSKSREKNEYLISGIFFSVLVFGLLIILGTMNSGYHLIDDHEFYRYWNTISERGLCKAIKINVKGELAIR